MKKKELKRRSMTSNDVHGESFTKDMTEEEIYNKLIELNYKARKLNNLDVSNHPYLKGKENE